MRLESAKWSNYWEYHHVVWNHRVCPNGYTQDVEYVSQLTKTLFLSHANHREFDLTINIITTNEVWNKHRGGLCIQSYWMYNLCGTNFVAMNLFGWLGTCLFELDAKNSPFWPFSTLNRESWSKEWERRKRVKRVSGCKNDRDVWRTTEMRTTVLASRRISANLGQFKYRGPRKLGEWNKTFQKRKWIQWVEALDNRRVCGRRNSNRTRKSTALDRFRGRFECRGIRKNRKWIGDIK